MGSDHELICRAVQQFACLRWPNLPVGLEKSREVAFNREHSNVAIIEEMIRCGSYMAYPMHCPPPARKVEYSWCFLGGCKAPNMQLIHDVLSRFDSTQYIEASRHRRITAWELPREEHVGYNSFCFGAGPSKASSVEGIEDMHSQGCCKDVSRTKPVRRPGCGGNFLAIPRKSGRRLSVICRGDMYGTVQYGTVLYMIMCNDGGQSERCHGWKRPCLLNTLYVTYSVMCKFNTSCSCQTCEPRLNDPFVVQYCSR